MRNALVAMCLVLVPTACSSTENLFPPGTLAEGPADEAPATHRSIRDDEACTLFTWPLSPPLATEVLKQTHIFTQTGVYRGGEPPPQIAAFNVLLDQADPLPYFDEIARSGGSAGRLYAVCAYQLLDGRRHDRLASDLRHDQATVFTQFGCIAMNQSVSELVEIVDKQAYGKYFRDARDRAYSYFDGPANICTRPTARGGADGR